MLSGYDHLSKAEKCQELCFEAVRAVVLQRLSSRICGWYRLVHGEEDSQLYERMQILQTYTLAQMGLAWLQEYEAYYEEWPGGDKIGRDNKNGGYRGPFRLAVTILQTIPRLSRFDDWLECLVSACREIAKEVTSLRSDHGPVSPSRISGPAESPRPPKTSLNLYRSSSISKETLAEGELRNPGTPWEDLDLEVSREDDGMNAYTEFLRNDRRKSSVCSWTSESPAAMSSAQALNCDDLFPIFTFCVVHSNLKSWRTYLSILSDFIDDSDVLGEKGYCLTTLQCALGLLDRLVDDPFEDSAQKSCKPPEQIKKECCGTSIPKSDIDPLDAPHVNLEDQMQAGTTPPSKQGDKDQRSLFFKPSSSATDHSLSAELSDIYTLRTPSKTKPFSDMYTTPSSHGRTLQAGSELPLTDLPAKPKRSSFDVTPVMCRRLFGADLSSDMIDAWVEQLTQAADLDPSVDYPWQYLYSHDGVKVYRRNSLSNGHQCVKGVGVIRIPPHQLFNNVWNLDNRCSYDDTLEEGRVVSTISPNIEALYLRLKPMRKRHKTQMDYCVMQHHRELPGGILCVVLRSIEHEDCPSPPKYCVRSKMYPSGWILRPSADGQETEITYVIHNHILGAPAWLQDAIAVKQALLIGKLRKFVEENAGHKI